MRAFLMYIDDWLSSKQIALMDAAEERGYLRLLLYAASEPDCGLPDSDAELACISLLGTQWGKPTAEESKRLGSLTSGDKLRRCFVATETGRIFNERLLAEFIHQKEVAEKRREAGQRGASASATSKAKAKQLLQQLVQQTGEQKSTNDVWVCGSVSVSDSSIASTPNLSDSVQETTEIRSPSPPAQPATELVITPTQEPSELEIINERIHDMSAAFENWWTGWASVKGTNHHIQAAHAWLSLVHEDNQEALFQCTASYLRSLDNPAGGYNPENFLFDQARDGFQARWPPRKGNAREERRAADIAEYREISAKRKGRGVG